MKLTMIAAFLLIIALMLKEASYFTANMIFTYKSTADKLVFVGGILLLQILTFVYADTYLKLIFGEVGVIAFFLMWFKQGVSEKGVLTLAHYGQEFFAWESVSAVKIDCGSLICVSWFDKNHRLLLKQKYSQSALAALTERLKSVGITIE